MTPSPAAMARTIAQALAEARTVLQDKAAPLRYSDADLLEGLNAAIAECRSRRPDLFLGRLRSALPAYTTADADNGVELPIDDVYFTPVVLYTAGRAELRDDDYAENGRAAMLINQLSQRLLGP